MADRAIGDVLVVKMDDGNTMTHYRVDQNYSDAANIAVTVVDEAHPGNTVASWAVCKAQALQDQCAGGADLDADVQIKKKSLVGAETIIPPNNMAKGDLDDNDDCVTFA